MSILNDPRHERFAQSLAQGRNASEAYREAGYKSHGGNAGRLKNREHIQARVKEILDICLEKAGITVDRIVNELGKIGFADVPMVQATAALCAVKRQALVDLGKHLGMWRDTIDINQRQTVRFVIEELPAASLAKLIDGELASTGHSHREPMQVPSHGSPAKGILTIEE